MTRTVLDAEMAAMWDRIQSRKVEPPKRESFQITTTVVHLTATEPAPIPEVENVDTYAGDPVPNPDAQGL